MPPFSHRPIRASAIGIAATFSAGSTAAQLTPSIPHVIDVSGDCPTTTAFSAEFERILPPLAERGPSLQPGARISVVDRGASYVVTVGERARLYADPKRDCEERARVGAVFAALTLYPPRPIIEPVPAAPPAATPVVVDHATVARASSPRSVRIQIALGARVDRSLDARSTASFGGDVRTAVMPGTFGAALGFGFHGPTTIPLGAATSVEEERVSLDLSLRYSPATHPLWIALDAGPAPNLRRFLGVGLPVVSRQTRFDIGARLSALVGVDMITSLRALPIAGFLGGSLEYEPTPYTMTVAPDGAVGRAPRAWIGGILGLSGAFE